MALAPEALPIIQSVEFVGNKVTRGYILRQEMLVKEGDPADPSRIEDSRQAIMNLGLFVSVRVSIKPVEGGVKLTLRVKEKYYILPVPKLNRDLENNFTLGGEISFDNLGGYNQQLKLRYETEEGKAVAGGDDVTYLFSYRYPRLFGGPWTLQTELTQDDSSVDGRLDSEDNDPTWLYRKQARTAGFQLTHLFAKTGPSVGWQGGGGLIWRRAVYDYVSTYPSVLETCDPVVPLVPCPEPNAFQDSTAVGVRTALSYSKVSDYLFSRKGVEYGYSGEFGTQLLGSDTTYTRHKFFWRYYHLLEGRPHENIDLHAQVGLSSGDMFLGDKSAYSVGGHSTLRAYESGTTSGNSYVLLNVQYLRPFFGYYPLRGVLFLDVGNAYPSNNEMHLGKLLWDVGVGVRFRLKSFVKIDLRVDVAYSPESGESRAYLGTKELF